MRNTFFIPVDLELKQLLAQAGHGELCNDLFIDKCHYIIDHLYLEVVWIGRKWRDFTPLHSQVLAEILGNHYAPRVKSILQKLGIIEAQRRNGRETYERGERSKSYRFCEKYRGADFYSVPINDERFIESLHRKGLKRFERQTKSHPLRELIARSIQRADFDAEAAKEFVESMQFETLHSENAYNYAIQRYQDKDWIFSQDRQGRLYHDWTHMPRKLRRFASYKGDALFAADVSASQPCLLSLLYKEDCEEKRRYVEIVKRNEFYQFFNDRLEIPYDLSDEDSKGQLKEEVFHRVFYGSIFAKPRPISEIFAAEFPVLAGRIEDEKRNHKRDLPVKLQKIEADIVVGEVATELARLYSDRDFCLITIHDCIVTTEEHVDECADRLCSAFGNRLGFRPTVKVKQITDDCVLGDANKEAAWTIVGHAFEYSETDGILDEQYIRARFLSEEEPPPDWEIPRHIERFLEIDTSRIIKQYEKPGFEDDQEVTASLGETSRKSKQVYKPNDSWMARFPWDDRLRFRFELYDSKFPPMEAKRLFLRGARWEKPELEQFYSDEYSNADEIKEPLF